MQKRLRGYQFKSEGGAKKKNPKAFNKLGGDRKEALEESETPPDIDAERLEQVGLRIYQEDRRVVF